MLKLVQKLPDAAQLCLQWRQSETLCLSKVCVEHMFIMRTLATLAYWLRGTEAYVCVCSNTLVCTQAHNALFQTDCEKDRNVPTDKLSRVT